MMTKKDGEDFEKFTNKCQICDDVYVDVYVNVRNCDD